MPCRSSSLGNIDRMPPTPTTFLYPTEALKFTRSFVASVGDGGGQSLSGVCKHRKPPALSLARAVRLNHWDHVSCLPAAS